MGPNLTGGQNVLYRTVEMLTRLTGQVANFNAGGLFRKLDSVGRQLLWEGCLFGYMVAAFAL